MLYKYPYLSSSVSISQILVSGHKLGSVANAVRDIEHYKF